MQIVLVNPDIPQNTGSIARTCAATQTPLHLVGKMGFEITEKAVRRAGLDYWPFVSLAQHQDFESYLATARPKKLWMVETSGATIYSEAQYGAEDALVFGSETKGLPPELLESVNPAQIVRIPIVCDGVRSLNLSNAVAVVLYEALRQLGQ